MTTPMNRLKFIALYNYSPGQDLKVLIVLGVLRHLPRKLLLQTSLHSTNKSDEYTNTFYGEPCIAKSGSLAQAARET